MAKRKVVIKEAAEETNSSDKKNGSARSTFNDLLIETLKTDVGGSAYVLGKDDAPSDVKEWLSTGSTVLDMCISNNPEVDGGIPVGRLTEIHGESSTGKSLLAYMILKSCADKGGISVLLDTETSAHIEFLKMLGLKPDENLVYATPDTVEDVFKSIETIITTARKRDKNRLVTIVWDSVAATSTRTEMEEDVGNKQVAEVPRLIGQGLRKIKRMIGDQRICLVFLNQMRSKIGVVFGDPMAAPGGNAIPFFSDVRLRLYTAGKIKAGNDVLGVGTKAKVLKTRFGPPFREAILSIYFDKGLIDEESWEMYLKDKKMIVPIPKSRRSELILSEDEKYEFVNKKFAELVRGNPELSKKISSMIKQDLYVEQDPEKREEELKLEDFEDDEL